MDSASGSARGRRLLDPAGVVAIAVASVWIALATAALRGALPVPYAPIVFLIGPFAAAAALLASGWRMSRAAWAAVAAAVLAAAALIGSLMIESGSLIAVGAPIAVATGVLAHRFPVAVTVALLALTGAVGTILVYTDLPPRYLVDAPLAGLVGALLWRAALDPDRPAHLVPVSVAVVLAYVAISLGQVLAAPSFSAAQQAFHNSTWQMLALPAIAFAGWSLATRLKVARGYVAVAALVAAYAVLRLIVGPSEAERELALELAPINLLPSGDLGLFGSATNRQQLAAWCGMAIPFSLALALALRGRWRLVAILTATLTGVAVVGSQTRVGLIGAVIGLGTVLALFALARSFPGLRMGGVVVAATGLLVALGIGLAVTDDGSNQVAERFSQIVDPYADPSFGARIATWENTIEDIGERPWGYGIGSSGAVGLSFASTIGFDPSAQGGVAIDNSYLKVGYEQGLVMMVVFALALLLTFGALCRIAVTLADPAAAAIAIAAAAAFSSFLVNLTLTDNIEDFTALTAWVLAGLGLAGLGTKRGAAATRS